MKKYLLFYFYLFSSIITYGQWSIISTPNYESPPPGCVIESSWAIGSTTHFYFCLNVGCGGGSGAYSYFKLYATEDIGENWTMKYSNFSDFAFLNYWYFISSDTGFIVENSYYGSQTLLRTYCGLNSVSNCPDCSFPQGIVFKMVDFDNMAAVQTWAGVKKFMVMENDTFKTVYNFPTPDYNYVKKIEFINGNYYLLSTNGLVLKSQDGGYNWDTSYNNNAQDLEDIKFSSDSIGFIIGDTGLILKTENHGITWEQKEISTIKNLKSIDYLNETTWITAGQDGVIFITHDGGNSWYLKSSPGSNNIREVRIPDKNEIIVVNNGSLWWADFNSLTNIESENEKQNLIILIPNPAKGKITISSSALTGITQLSIFNVSGEKVLERQLINTETQLDISTLPQGVYFVKLQNEKMVELGKIVKE